MVSAATLQARRTRRLLLASIGLLLLTPRSHAQDLGKAEIRIDNFTFQPAVLRVAPGTTVVWSNQDDIPHTIVLVTVGARSGPLETDATFSHRFDMPGAFPYICGLHPHMKGQVIVAA